MTINQQRREQQGGFALMLVTVMAAVLAIALYNELPRLMFESQRAKEEVLVQRANQYVRAVQLFQRKLKRAPQTIDDLENTNQLRFLRRRYVDPFTGKDDWRIIKSDELAKRQAQKQGQAGQTGQNGATGTTGGLSTTSPIIPTPEQLSTLTGQATTSTFAPGVAPRRASDTPGFPRPGGDPNQNTNFTDPNAPPPDPNNPPPPPSYAQPGPVVAGQPSFPGSNLPPGFLPPGVIPQQGQRPVTPFPGYPTTAANSQSSYQPFQPGANQPSPGSSPPTTADQNPALQMISKILTSPNPNGAQIAQAAAAGTTQMGVGIVGVASKYDAEGIKRFNDKSNIKEWEFIYDQTQDKSLQKPGGPSQIGTPIGQSGNGNNNSSPKTGFGGFGGQPQIGSPPR